MDKKKIISSLTVAGMVATTAAGAGVFAADTDATTEFRGENTTAISGKTLSTFRLQSSTDRVTGKDLKVAYPGKTVSAADTDTFKTGDVVKIDGNYRTIVIYGDATTDGKVTISDATRVIGAIQDPTNNGLTDIQKVAADLNGDGKIKISDVTPVIAAISNETYSEMLAPSNTAKPEPVAEVSNIEIAADGGTITVKYDNDASTNEYTLMDNKAKKKVKVTSSFNTATNKATLKVGEELKENTNGDQTYTLTVKNNGKTISEKTFSLTKLNAISTVAVDGTKMPVTNKTVTAINSENVGNLALKVTTAAANDEDATVVVTLKDSAERETTGSAKLAKDTTQVVVNNFASSEVKELKDGPVTVTAYVIDADGNKAGENKDKTKDYTSTITKDTKEFKIASVTATRAGEKLTAIEPTYVNGAEDKKDNDDRAVYFKVVETGTSAPTADTILSEVDANKKYNERLSDVKLDTGKTYTVYVVSVNANGNVSNVSSYDIPNIDAEALEKVATPTATEGVNGEYTWKDDKNDEKDVKAYRVTLKNGDGKVISTKEVTEKKVNVLADLKAYVEDDDNTLTTPTIEVVALPANADYTDSTAVSANVDLTDLRLNISTAGLTLGFDDETNHQILTWKDVANADSYVLNVYKYVKDSKGDKDVVAQDAIYTSSPISKNADKRYDLTNALSKLGVGKYAVTIKALADSDSKYVDSVESAKPTAQTPGIATYYLKAPTDLKATVKSDLKAEVTLSKVDGLIGDDTVTYTLVYKQKTGTTYGDKKTKANLATDSQDSDKIKDTTTTGLEADTTYKMYVKVMSDVNNELARTNEIEVKVTKQPMAVGKKYTLVDLSKQANNYLTKSQIAVSGDTLLVGKEGAEAKDAPIEVKSNDDYSRYQEVIEVAKALKADDTLTLTDDSMNVTSNAKNADYKQALKNVDLTIAKDNAVIAGTFNSVMLDTSDTGVKTSVNLEGANIAEEVTVDKAIKVYIASGTTVKTTVANVVVNDVTVGTKTKVTGTDNGLDIEGITDEQTLTYTGDVNVNITKTQVGQLTITSANDDDKLTLTSANALTLNVTGGKVDVSALKGSTITVSEKGTLVIKGTNDNKVMAGKTETTIVANSGEVKVTVGKDTNSISVEGNAKITSEDVAGAKKTETATGDINVEQDAENATKIGDGLLVKNENGSTKYTVEKDNGDVTITSTGTTVITGKATV